MKYLSKPLIITGLAGILILSACNKDTVKNDKVYKAEGNSTVSTSSGTIPNVQPQASSNKTKVPNLDQGGLLSQTELQVLLKKVSGPWVNENWISNLKRTKSIINSTCAMPVLHINIADNGAFYLEGPSDTFHDAGLYSTYTNDVYTVTEFDTHNKFFKVNLNKDTNNDVIHNENKKDEPFILISINADKLEYYCGDIKRSFTKISDLDKFPNNIILDKFTNNIILAGKYVDEKGSSYSFTDDGTVILPNLKGKYSLSFNADYEGLDTIRIADDTGKESVYNYEIKDKLLNLYKVTLKENSDSYERDKTPYIVLKKVE